MESYFALSLNVSFLPIPNLRQRHLTIWLLYLFGIDMYSEGVADLGEMIMHLPLCPPAEKDAKLTNPKRQQETVISLHLKM